MIVATTYPLYLENQLLNGSRMSNTPSLRSALEFSSEGSEGVYNAAVALLNNRERFLDYSLPAGFKLHPLWIDLVGDGQLWPISASKEVPPAFPFDDYMYSIPSDLRDTNSESSTAHSERVADLGLRPYPKPFLLLAFFIAIGCSFAWIIVSFSWTSDQSDDSSLIGRLFSKIPASIKETLGPSVLPQYVAVRRRQVNLLSVVLFGLLATVSYYYFLPIESLLAKITNGGILSFSFLLVLGGASGVAAIVPRNWLGASVTKVVRLFCLSALGIACVIGLVFWRGDAITRTFLFMRASDLSSKVSPLVALLLVYSAAIALILGELYRQALMESRSILAPFLDFKTESFSGLTQLENRVREATNSGGALSQVVIFGLVAILYLLAFPDWPPNNLDTRGFKWVFFLLSLGVYVGIALALTRMVMIWLGVRAILRRLYTHASRYGYAGYRDALHMSPEATGNLFSKVPAMSQIEVALDQVRLLLRTTPAATSSAPEVITRLTRWRPWLAYLLPYGELCIDRFFDAEATDQWRLQIWFMQFAETLMGFFSAAIGDIFEPLWRTVSEISPGASLMQQNSPKHHDHNKGNHELDSDGCNSIDRIGEIYVASRVVDLLRHAMPQLETLVTTSTLAMLLMLLAVSSYPFPARDDLLWFSWFAVLATVGSAMWMFFSLNRDRVASMILGTSPGHTDWNSTLVLQVAAHALVPILVLLGAAFPAKLGVLATWAGSLLGGHS